MVGYSLGLRLPANAQTTSLKHRFQTISKPYPERVTGERSIIKLPDLTTMIEPLSRTDKLVSTSSFAIRSKTAPLPVDLPVGALIAEGCEIERPRYPLVHQQHCLRKGTFWILPDFPSYLFIPC